MEDEEITRRALELICKWLAIAFIIILCGFGWFKIIELLSIIGG